MFTAKKVGVPGILDDDALAIQLDLLKKQQTDTAKVAPPPDAAYEFADKLQRDYLSQPQPTVQVAPRETPGVRLSPEQQADQQRAGGIIDAIGRPAASIGMGILGPALEGLRHIGTLTPEESELATEEAVKDAEEHQKAVGAQADIRAKLRAMPDTEAAELGLPVAPGGTDEVARGAGLVQDLGIRKEAAKDVETAKKEPVTQKWWLNAAQTAARSAAQMGTGVLRNGPIVWELLRDVYQLDELTGEGRSYTRAWVDTVDASLDAMLPGDKAQSRDFITALSSGAGSFAGFMVASFIGSAFGLPPGVTVGALGAAVGGQQGFTEAERFGAGAIQKYWSYMLNAGLGLSEAVPIDRMFMRSNVSTGGLIIRALNASPAGALEEFFQEFGQSFGEDIIAKWGAGFDPDRELDAREWVKQGVVGGLTGGAGGAVTALSPIAGVSENLPPVDQQEALVAQALAATQLRFDQIEGIGDVVDNAPPEGGADLATEAVEGVEAQRAEPRFVSLAEDAAVPSAEKPVAESVTPAVRVRGEMFTGATHADALALANSRFGNDIVAEIDADPEAFVGYAVVDAEAKVGDAAPSRGGTMPATREDGKIELTHWAAEPRATLDPGKMGSGPLRGQERKRLVGPDAVPRTYYGVDAKASMSAKERRKIPFAEQRRMGYVRETGLGNIRHTVAVDPNDLYNWYEDPLNLKAGLDRELAASEQITQYERIIRDAGFKGYYIDEGKQGQTVAMFEQAVPERIIDERTGEEIGPPSDEYEALAGVPILEDSNRAMQARIVGTGGKGGNKITVRDIAVALTDAHMEEHGRQLFPEESAEDFNSVRDMAMAEMRNQLSRANSGVGWYNEDVDRAIEMTARMFPKLTQLDHRDLYLSYAGIFSNGMTPEQAWVAAADAYRFYEQTGRLPVKREKPDGSPVGMTTFKKPDGTVVTKPIGWGVRGAANEKQMELLNYMIGRFGGIKATMDWMRSRHPRTEINAMMLESGHFKEGRFKSKAQQQGDAYGALVFGEKLGRYILGLQGVEVTADDTTVDLWYTRTFRRWTGRLLEPPIDDSQGIAGRPANDRERETVFRITEEMGKEFKLSAGDVQAVLWFFEKRLWGELGINTNEGTNSSGAIKLLTADAGADSDGSGGEDFEAAVLQNVSEARPSDFETLTQASLLKPGWAIVTATQEAEGDPSSPANVAANQRLREELQATTDAIEIGGTYQGVDQGPSFIVFMPEADAVTLGRRYGQESVLTNRGLVYSDGRLTPAVPSQTVVGDEARRGDFFSTMPDGTSFSVGLDFDATTQPQEGMFAGANAMGNAREAPNLLLARQMDDDGRDMRDIWTATGWFRGTDGRWRFEIADTDAEFTSFSKDAWNSEQAQEAYQRGSFVTIKGRLGDVMSHDKLFSAYPALRDIPVELTLHKDPGESGSYNPNTTAIEATGPNEESVMETLLHEVQHAIQHIEGFNAGGNQFSGELYEGPAVDEARKTFEEVKADPMSTAGEIAYAQEQMRMAAARTYYDRIAGEVEARNAAERGMHARAGRQAAEFYGENIEPQFPQFPPDTADVPVEDQIVIMRTPTTYALSMMEEPSTGPAAAQSTPVGTSAARGVYTGELTRPPEGIPETEANKDQDANLAKISKNFINILGLTVRQGRFTLKGSNVWGQYTARQRVVRLKTWNDLSTLIHEGGHALHDMMAGPLRSFVEGNAQEFMKVADQNYGGDTNTLNRQQHLREGFAEFLRLYTINRARALRLYPDLHDQFAELLARRNPELAQGLDLIQQQFMAYLQAPSTQVVKGMMAPRKPTGINAAIQELREVGFRSWMSEYTRQTLEETVNRFAPLNSLVTDLLNLGERNQGAAIDLTRAKDPRTLARLAPNFGARTMIQLTDGIVPYHSTEPASASLRDGILVSQGLLPADNPRQLDEARLDAFDEYLVALRSIDEYRRHAEGKIDRPPVHATLGDVTQAAVDLAKKYGTFPQAAQMIHDFGMAMWRKQYDAGLMTRETYVDGLDRQFYVPLQRDMSDKQSRFPDNALTGPKRLVQRFKGSDRLIVSPTAVLMHKLFSLEKVIAENEVKRSLAQLADRVGTAGALVERIPASKIVGQRFEVRDIARQLTKDDTLSDADAADLMTILAASIKDGNTMAMFRSEQITDAGENIIFFLDEGKVQALLLKDGDIGADIVNLLNGLGRENMGFGMELIAGTSQFYRAAITSWPDFLIVNFIRDQMSAWVLNNVGFTPFATGLRGMADEVRQRQWAKRYNASMGIMGGMGVSTLHKARMNRDINSLKNKGYIHMAFGEPGFMGALGGFTKLIELSETGTRLGLFRKAYERSKADGLDDWEASVEAAYLATDYIDFGLNGNRMLAARRTIPFLNAQIQGFYKMVRTLGADEVRQRKGLKFVLRAYFKSTKGMDLSRVEKNAVRTGRAAWVKMSILGMLSALLHFIFEDDEDYQEIGEYMRVTQWNIPLGDGRIVSIPKPFELAMIANAVERGLEYASGDDTAKSKFLRGALLSLTPPVAPPAIQSVVEYMANKDFFTGQEIVPDYMAALPPELQYNSYTSEFAKEIGEITGWSPLVMEHFMSGLGASAYRDMTTMTNALDPNRPNMDATDAPIARRFIRDVRRGSQTAKDFWAQASMLDGKLRTAETGYKTYLEQGNEPAAHRYLNSLSDDEQAYAMLATHFKAEQKRLNPFYRGRQISTIISGMRREIVSSLGLEDTDKYADEPNIALTAKKKAQVDELLSEIVRREMRNTLVSTGAPGWTNKKPMPVDPTMALLEETSPRAYDELVRRLDKAKVYDGQAVFEGWPEVRDRLLQDREDAFLDDMVSAARAFR